MNLENSNGLSIDHRSGRHPSSIGLVPVGHRDRVPCGGAIYQLFFAIIAIALICRARVRMPDHAARSFYGSRV